MAEDCLLVHYVKLETPGGVHLPTEEVQLVSFFGFGGRPRLSLLLLVVSCGWGKRCLYPLDNRKYLRSTLLAGGG